MANENHQMTKEEVLQATIDVLGSIRAPISEKESIIDPIMGAITNLLIYQEMVRREAEMNANPEKEETAKEDLFGEEDTETEAEDGAVAEDR